MSRVNLGSVTFIPYYECYLAFNMEIDGFNGIGGYKTVNGWKYVLSDAFIQGTPTMNEQGVAQISFSGKRGQWFK